MLKSLSSAFIASALLIAADCTITNAQSKPPDLPLNTKETCVPLYCPAGMQPGFSYYGMYSGPGLPAAEEQEQGAPAAEVKNGQPVACKTWGDALSDWFDDNLGPTLEAWLPGALEAWGNVQDQLVLGLGGIFSNPYEVATGEQDPKTPVQSGNTQALPTGHGIQTYLGSIFGGPYELATGDQDPKTAGPSQQPLDAEAFKAHAAQRFCEIALECEAKGDAAMARNCYEEAIRVCPGSEFAALASAKLGRTSAAPAVAANPKPMLLGGIEASEPPPQALVPADLMAPTRIQESFKMLELGQHYERSGDLDNAYRCYQNSHIVCPACAYGRQALQMMIDIEVIRSVRSQRTRGDFESQEPPMKPQKPTPEVIEPTQTLLWYDLGW